ncbi:hypothetical protein AB7X32_21300 [Morganella morganii]|uniref:hypothetical protein n=1 Tax=Morganella morganii TaxID=582 RepID=UPI0034E3854D
MGEKMKKTGRMVSAIKMKWWVPVFIFALALLAKTIRINPDRQRIVNFVMKHGFSTKSRFE